ncbi:MAG: hypothetical protein ACQESB_05445 [Elusimicrobiota bacterium]
MGILKCRFKSDKAGIYGLFMFIFNIREDRILRVASVAGCNPEICESDINKNWFSFEKNLYSRRLKEGSLRGVTQRMEQALLKKLNDKKNVQFFQMYREENEKGIKDLFQSEIKEIIKFDTGQECEVDLKLKAQRLNLRQFRYLTESETIGEEFTLFPGEKHNIITQLALNSEIVKAANTKIVRVEKIESGDMVFTKITDSRDIGIYLSHLLGARKGDSLIPLSVSVADVKNTKEGIEVIVRFGPGIVGRAIEDPRKKVSVWRDGGGRDLNWLRAAVVALAVLVLYYLVMVIR